ncbi:MAG: hypothetical protein HC804_00200 [Anaerolineae bacterium]|nr:hypothetical protein [Anaerolineae bacterium]
MSQHPKESNRHPRRRLIKPQPPLTAVRQVIPVALARHPHPPARHLFSIENSIHISLRRKLNRHSFPPAPP